MLSRHGIITLIIVQQLYEPVVFPHSLDEIPSPKGPKGIPTASEPTTASAAEPWSSRARADGIPPRPRRRLGIEPLVTASRALEQRVVERRMHAAAHPAGPRQPAPRHEAAAQRVVRAQAGRVQVVVADAERRAAGAGHAQPPAEPARRPVDLELVLEARRGEVAGGDERPARRRGEGVVEGVGAGGLGQAGLLWSAGSLWRAAGALAPGAVGIVAGGAVVGVVFLVAFLLQSGDEPLDDVDLEESGEVGDAGGGDEDVLQLRGEVGAVLSAGLGVQGDAEREGSRGDIVAGEELETVDAVGADGEAADLNLGAHAVGLEDELHGGLVVGVEKGVGRDGGVPLSREARRKGSTF